MDSFYPERVSIRAEKWNHNNQLTCKRIESLIAKIDNCTYESLIEQCDVHMTVIPESLSLLLILFSKIQHYVTNLHISLVDFTSTRKEDPSKRKRNTNKLNKTKQKQN